MDGWQSVRKYIECTSALAGTSLLASHSRRVSASFSNYDVDLPPLQRQCKRKVNMQRALAAVAGYTSTMEAWRREPGETEGDISDTFHFLYKEVISYLKEKGRDFENIVQKKRMLYGLQAVA